MTTQQAQAAVVAAQVEVERAKRATATEQLVAVRAEGREAARKLKKVRQQLRVLDAELIERSAMCAEVNAALDSHLDAKPDMADFPTETELDAWSAELRRLQSARLAAGQAHIVTQAKRAVPLQESLQLDQQIIALLYTSRNLEAIVRGEKTGGWPEGGVSAVFRGMERGGGGWFSTSQFPSLLAEVSETRRWAAFLHWFPSTSSEGIADQAPRTAGSGAFTRPGAARSFTARLSCVAGNWLALSSRHAPRSDRGQ